MQVAEATLRELKLSLQRYSGAVRDMKLEKDTPKPSPASPQLALPPKPQPVLPATSKSSPPVQPASMTVARQTDPTSRTKPSKSVSIKDSAKASSPDKGGGVGPLAPRAVRVDRTKVLATLVWRPMCSQAK